MANPSKDSLRSEELNKWIHNVNNLSSRTHDPAQAIKFLRDCEVSSLLNAECALEVLNEVKDEIHSAKEDFLRMALHLCKRDV